MLLIRAIVRPEKKDDVLAELSSAGFNAATMVDVVGRGKQKGIKIGGMVYDEIPKTLILMVIPDEDKGQGHHDDPVDRKDREGRHIRRRQDLCQPGR